MTGLFRRPGPDTDTDTTGVIDTDSDSGTNIGTATATDAVTGPDTAIGTGSDAVMGTDSRSAPQPPLPVTAPRPTSTVTSLAHGQRSAAIAGDAGPVITGDGNILVTVAHGATREQPSPAEIEAATRTYAHRVRETYGRLDLAVITPLDDQHAQPVVRLQDVFVPPLVRAEPRTAGLAAGPVRRIPDREGHQDHEDHQDHQEHQGQEQPSGPPPLSAPGRTAYLGRHRQSVLSLLAAPGNRCVVLLGDPGSGKSTVARYVALTLLATGEPPRPVTADDPPHPITTATASHPPATATATALDALAGTLPVIIELRRFAETRWHQAGFEELLRHLHGEEGLCVPFEVLRVLLDQGRALLVLDGLDEIFDRRLRREMGRRIAEFARANPLARIVVTSRTVGYEDAVLDDAGFGHHLLQDLDPAQIETFVRRWYAIACPHDLAAAERLSRRLTGALRRSRQIGELAGNPLLLTILAIIGRRRSLPRHRRGVYAHAVSVLVAHWDLDAKLLDEILPPAVADVLGPEERMDLLEFLACRMQEGRSGIAGNQIHSAELHAVFREFLARHGLPEPDVRAGARALVAHLWRRDFILARYGGDMYGFVHRAFLEYLAARDIVARYRDRRSWTDIGDLLRDVVTPHVADPSWREVLLLLAGQLNDDEAAAMIEHLLDLYRRSADPGVLVLAARCLAECGRPHLLAAQSRMVVDELTTALTVGSGDGLRELGPVLAGLPDSWEGRERYLRWFHLSGQFVPEYRFYEDGGLVISEESAAAHLACHLYGEPARLHTLARFHEGGGIRAAALRVLAEQGPWGPRSLELVLERAVVDRDDRVRRTALQVLGEHWWREEPVRALLLRRAADETSDYARGAALTALAQRWADDERTLDVLRAQAGNTRSVHVARTAFGLLGQHWADRQEVRELAYRALDSTVGAVRAGALWMVAEHYEPRAHMADVLRERAVHDPYPLVRSTALTLLAERWPQDVLDPGLLRERAVRDDEPAVRRAALRALVDRCADDPDVWTFLVHRAAVEPRGEPRMLLLRTLAERRPDDERVTAVLLDHAERDRNRTSRLEALKSVAARRLTDGRAADLLLARAVEEEDPQLRGAALRLLAGQWPDGDGRARALLLKQAVHDLDRHPRVVALQVLATQWPQDPEVRRLLIERAVDDPAARPRATALDLLGERYPQDAEVRALFAERAAGDRGHPREAAFRRWLLGHEDAESAVREQVGRDADPDLRELAVRMLVWQWPHRPGTAQTVAEALRREVSRDGAARDERAGPVREHLAVLTSLRERPPAEA
ncbi:HEAT repeat domain-containing protein [Streptomyces sp. NPDC088785]|uniref:HEAT repeat domain-containing protein n=1 Tax=Streptomyces sp. NPDC088785 TaxID=3365897 RepID=UPI00380D377C